MFNKKGIAIGNDDFKDVITQDCYFVDKSKFIEEILNDKAKIKLFCRPRRFGKTLNMSMLKYFFDIRNKIENRKLFNGLYIEDSPMIKEQGNYPVIFITMKELKGNNFEAMSTQIRTLISDLFNQYEYLRESLNSRSLKIFDKIWNREDEDYENSLKFLINCLSEYHQQKVIILIDEYDTPLLTAHEFGYYNEALQFFKIFYGGALKSNANLQMGVLTGIIRVAQAGIFSDLNNFYSNTILENEYSKYFGLLENEVEDMLKYYEVECKLEEVKEWYNGYTFGNTQVYNPWSILHFVRVKE
uniref:AAA family ATPase n=1 Tax=Fusobacterium sp. SYSU M8D902 TaxID=3159562 RepID=UPI0032E46AE4